MKRALHVSLSAAVSIALAAAWLAAPAAAGPARGAAALMPVPEKLTVMEGRFRIDETLAVAGQGPAGERAFHAAARFMTRLAGRTGLFFKQDYLAYPPASGKPALFYSFQRVGKLEPNEDESYTLTVKPDAVALSAVTDIGVLRGFETLLQLLDADEAGYYFPCLAVQDRPRFTWRGLLIDVGRHFEPVAVIKRNLDGMAAVKLNVFHWHLTEDQGFRVESKAFPKLCRLGSDGMFYTQDQIRDVIGYAADRGIRVMPEFDIPGHSTSWLVAYPEQAAAPGPYEIERHFGVFGPAFDPTNEKVYGFFDRFFKEMAGLFPDPYIHIGGDEVNPDQWNANRAIRVYMKAHGFADNDALQAHFNSRVLKILTRYGKKMVGWDEVFQPGLPKTIVIHSWRGPESLVAAARKGYQGILSNGYYIDLCQPAAEHYLNDPIPAGSPLTDAEKALILGGEATMWGEMVTSDTIDSRIWPRTAAIAERLWSPASVTSVEDMYRRLELVETGLEELGLNHVKYQAMMLRRLSGAKEVRPLEVLASVTEPLRGYERSNQGITYSTLSPFTRFVDACFPESLAARTFRVKVGRFLETRDQGLAAELRALLVRWKTNHPSVLPFLASSPALREVEGLSMALESVSGTGLEALELLASGKAPEKGWVEGGAKLLEEAKKPKAQCRLAVVDAVEKLVGACVPAGK